MQTLRVSLVQGATRWHDPAGNRAYYGDLIAPLAGSDLVLLPETFTSGFSNEAIHNAETMDGPTVAWLSEQARKLDAAICGSVQLRVDEKVYNRLLFATPDGNIRHYDKRHLFRYADEHKRYAAGGERLIVEWRGQPVWVFKRTPEMLATLPGLDSQVADPMSKRTDFPTPAWAQNVDRAPEAHKDILVVVGICTHLGCSPVEKFKAGPQPSLPDNWEGGFFCPCHGSTFDFSARVFKDKPAPANLVVPPYTYLSDTKLLIGEEKKA